VDSPASPVATTVRTTGVAVKAACLQFFFDVEVSVDAVSGEEVELLMDENSLAA